MSHVRRAVIQGIDPILILDDENGAMRSADDEPPLALELLDRAYAYEFGAHGHAPPAGRRECRMAFDEYMLPALCAETRSRAPREPRWRSRLCGASGGRQSRFDPVEFWHDRRPLREHVGAGQGRDFIGGFGQVRGPGQRLGLGATLPSAHRLRQVDRQVSEHQTRPRWGLERLGAEFEGPCQSGALCGSQQASTSRRWRRLIKTELEEARIILRVPCHRGTRFAWRRMGDAPFRI